MICPRVFRLLHTNVSLFFSFFFSLCLCTAYVCSNVSLPLHHAHLDIWSYLRLPCWRSFLSQSIHLPLLFLTQRVCAYAHAWTRGVAVTHTSAYRCQEVNCPQWPRAPSHLWWASLSGLCLILQVFHSQPLFLSSWRSLCHRGCSWKCPSSHFVCNTDLMLSV